MLSYYRMAFLARFTGSGVRRWMTMLEPQVRMCSLTVECVLLPEWRAQVDDNH